MPLPYAPCIFFAVCTIYFLKQFTTHRQKRAVNILFPLSILAASGYIAVVYRAYVHEAAVLQRSADAGIFTVLSLFAVSLVLLTSPFLISSIWLVTGLFRLIRSLLRKQRDRLAILLLIAGGAGMVVSLVFIVNVLQAHPTT